MEFCYVVLIVVLLGCVVSCLFVLLRCVVLRCVALS